MRKFIIIFFINLVILNIQGRNTMKDSLIVYNSKNIELLEFLEQKIRAIKKESDSLFHKNVAGYGVLKVDSSKVAEVVIHFRYYDFHDIFENEINGSWGVWYIKTTPIFLEGIFDNRIFMKTKRKIWMKTQKTFDGTLDPFFIRMRLKFETQECVKHEKTTK